jgi:hypothetical protein
MPKPIKAPAPISTNKSLTLNLMQRLKIKAILDTAQTRSPAEGRLHIRIVDKIAITDEEIKKSDMRQTSTAQGQVFFGWDQGKDIVADFEFSNEEFARLKSFFESWGPTAEDLRTWLEDVLGQLGI